MAIGKNKRLLKAKKGGGKSRVIDPFTKKEWYHLKAPPIFATRDCGLTCCSKTQGTKIARNSLRGRVYEINLADLQNGDEEQNFRKIKLYCEEVKDKLCLLDFHGMDMTRDRLCRLIRKWHSLIEAHADIRTLDGYYLRIFCIAQTDRNINHVRATCYAQTSKIKMIRRLMIETIVEKASAEKLGGLVKIFITENIGRDITAKCARIFPIRDVYIRKVKVLKKPKFDVSKFLESTDDAEAVPVQSQAPTMLIPEQQNILTQELQDEDESWG